MLLSIEEKRGNPRFSFLFVSLLCFSCGFVHAGLDPVYDQADIGGGHIRNQVIARNNLIITCGHSKRMFSKHMLLHELPELSNEGYVPIRADNGSEEGGMQDELLEYLF